MNTPIDKRFILHIGLSKTATTTLQELVFARHPQVYYLGKYLDKPDLNQSRGPVAHEFLTPLLWNHHTPQSTDHAHRSLECLRQDPESTRPVWLASWEELGNRPLQINLETLRRFKQLMGDFRLLICLRNPLDRIPSEYLQSLRYQYLEFCKQPLKTRNLLYPSYFTLERWLSRHHATGYLSILLNASELIREACKLIGRENVGVSLFEDFRQRPSEFFQSMFRFMEIAPGDMANRFDKHQRRLNTRLTVGQLDYLRKLRRLSWRKIRLIGVNRDRRKHAFHEAGKDNIPATIALCPTWRKTIMDETKAGNRWIADTFDLPLETYGYPL